MTGEMRAWVRLGLNDNLSPGLRRAAAGVRDFGAKASAAFGAVGSAFSGIGGAIAGLGVAMGGLALARGVVSFEDRVTRIATAAGASGAAANELGRRLRQVAIDAAVPSDALLAFAQTAAESAVSLDAIYGNSDFMARAIQAFGMSGEEAGRLFATFYSRGAGPERIEEIINNVTEITARAGNVGVGYMLRYLPRLIESSAQGLDGIESIVTEFNILAAGTDTAVQAAYRLRAVYDDLSNLEIRRAFYAQLGFEVTDETSIFEVFEALDPFSHLKDTFSDALGTSRGFAEAMGLSANHAERVLAGIGELGDTSGAVALRAEQNAGTMQSSLVRLQETVRQFGDEILTGPLQKLADLLSRNPQGLRLAVYGVAGALALIAAAKGVNTIAELYRNIKGAPRGGGGAAVPPAGGGLGRGLGTTPVFVTNWPLGGMGGRRRRPGARPRPGAAPRPTAAPRTGRGPRPRSEGRRMPQSPFRRRFDPGLPPAPAASPVPASPAPGRFARLFGRGSRALGAAGRVAGPLGAAASTGMALMDARAEFAEIAADETLSDRERREAQGGAAGEAAGAAAGHIIGGAAGVKAGGILAGALLGAKKGAVVGTVVPGIGNAVGAVAGLGIGALAAWGLGRAGRRAGEAVGAAGYGGDGADAAMPPAYPEPPAWPSPPAFAASSALPTPVPMPVPAMLAGPALREEIAAVAPPSAPAPQVAVDGDIRIESFLSVEGGSLVLRQEAGRNTTPFRFDVGSAAEARMIQ